MSVQENVPEQSPGFDPIQESEERSDLEDYGRELAASHILADPDPKGQFLSPPLIHYLSQYEDLFERAIQYFRGASEAELAVSYAAEWMLDNIHIVMVALREVEEDLPQSYYRQLPKLAGGVLEGLPRVYALAKELILFERAHLDVERARRFIDAYQSLTPLSMGEIWALPIMLRLGILQCLALSVSRIAGLPALEEDRHLPVIDLSPRADDDEVVANSILSLRTLAAQDWKDFFEATSLVEAILRQDPADFYAGMDFETRDRYRKIVEELAQAAEVEETAVVEGAIRLAQEAKKNDWELPSPAGANPGKHRSRNRDAHVGSFLLGESRPFLERQLGYQPSPSIRLKRWFLAHATWVYLGSIGVLSLLFIVFLLGYVAYADGAAWHFAVAAALSLVPAVTIAVNLVNWVVTLALKPKVLPKMDFSDGIPEGHEGLVVIPALLSSMEEVDSLVGQLELHFLRNPDQNLFYALLTDFTDAHQQHSPDDGALIPHAVQQIQALNQRYWHESAPHFFLFHRPRRWNPKEERWMGWERKRGKLHELNRLILKAQNGPGVIDEPDDRQLGGEDEPDFTVQPSDLGWLRKIRYIITLDADTVLPRESARRLVATLAHPLNWPVYDERGRLVSGYSVLQPRTEISPTSANQSRFTKIFTGDTGLDLYTRAVSDVYQDLFGEGIYIGKGIYAVEAFERSLEGRMPENALLSHDLFEGLHARAALVTDIVLIEEFPPNYLAHSNRLSRWIRGDWQLLPWLFTWVPTAGGRKKPNLFSVIDRWKILDNLRRSLISPAVFAWLLAGWLGAFPGSPWIWMLVGLLTLAAPLITGPLNALLHSIRAASLSSLRRSLDDTLQRLLLALVFLPYETLVVGEAITTTLVRLFLTRKHLLRWTTSAQAALRFGEGRSSQAIWGQMALSLGMVLGISVVIWLTVPDALAASAPLLITWLLSPQIVYVMNRSVHRVPTPLSPEQMRHLRNLARRTWLFFEQFLGPEDHWLPPDHFQEVPLGIVAHRTSPTNIGLSLISILSAYALGYLGLLDLISRLSMIFESMENLERYRGHFLNWYDTRNLEPLPPRYVSTVDSGNLAGSLIAIKQCCLELHQARVLRWETMQGLADTLVLVIELVDELAVSGVDIDALSQVLDELDQQILGLQESPRAWAPWLARFSGETIGRQGIIAQEEGAEGSELSLQSLDQHLMLLVEAHAGEIGSENLRKLRIFTRRIHLHVSNALREIDLLLPWSRIFANPPAILLLPDLDPALQAAWRGLREKLVDSPQIHAIDEVCGSALGFLDQIQELLEHSSINATDISRQKAYQQEALEWCSRLRDSLDEARLTAKALLIGAQEIAKQAANFLQAMDFRFLFDKQRQVFHIGYNVASEKLDNNYYDLLASEARIASLVAIAKGDIPQSHWLHLGRPMTRVDGTQALLSWSATMFEYLMPAILFRSYAGTILRQSEEAAVAHQIDYGERKRVPWGISESGYYRFDANQFYQYQAFGVPGLGYKRGLGEDLVITPYASLLALSYAPLAVIKNIYRLTKLGMLGTYGFYEAIDFTSSRLSLGREHEIVRSFMAHHQGMIFVTIANMLTDDKIVKCFHAEPHILSVDLLLQEKVPQDAPIQHPHAEDERAIRPEQARVTAIPWQVPVQMAQPGVHFLSNGRFGVLINNAGGGYSTWLDTDLTRWRADTTLNNWGTWIYVKDLDSGAVWSATHQPTLMQPESQDVYFNAHAVEFHRQDDEISTVMEITVPPDGDVEIRKLTLTNHTSRRRRMFVTSYGEVILAPQRQDQRHPAFNKLFIESEWAPQVNALIFRRRPRSEEEEPLFLAHSLVVGEGMEPPRTYEGDRKLFLGRGCTPRTPVALTSNEKSEPSQGQTGPLAANAVQYRFSETVGATLDPIFAIGQEIVLEPNESVQIAYLTLAAHTRLEALALSSRYGDWHTIQRAFEQAQEQSEVEMLQLGLTTEQLKFIQLLLSLLLYPHSALRPNPERIAKNELGQPGLWAFSISGDYPILLVCIYGPEDLNLVREALQAHIYWRSRNLKIDLVILNEQGTNYGQELFGQLRRLIESLHSEAWLNRRGGIFILPADRLSEQERILLETVAGAILNSQQGSLADQVAAIGHLPERLPEFTPRLMGYPEEEPLPPVMRPAEVSFFNGLGGFSPGGREYIIYLGPGSWTPAPWINVIANPEFGCLVSETGSGYSWAINSGENRLTPWSNDPVSEPPGEALYLRDEETAEVWSPTPLPAGAPTPYLIRHGAGYTIFEHNSHGFRQSLRIFVIPDAPVKIVQLKLENGWNRVRRITATYYTEWVLGVNREDSQAKIVPDFDTDRQALLARNPYNVEFGERVAFLAAAHMKGGRKPLHGLTADRTEFLGRAGDRALPAALQRIGLSGTVQAGLDPCGVLQLHLDLQPGEADEVYFLIGQGADREAALSLVEQYQDPQHVENAWKKVHQHWDNLLGAVCVQTPDPAMDFLLNRWLLYQALSCRIWGRSAFYQSSGAFGFRDQLQDVLALLFAKPEIAREHLLRSAAHQFEAGDVLHWWHPPSGRGVRTRISDDLLWLPYTVAHYVTATGDESVLDEKIPYRSGPPLEPQEEERYGHFATSSPDEKALAAHGGAAYTLFEHCRRALEQGMTSGPHNLPLMGAGDWNDGMNRVGSDGRGESVWLGWFLYDTLSRFAGICERRGEERQARVYRQHATDLAASLEESAWDGAWYLRGFYDDGSPLGSASNRECQIDSIAQSWAVLSGAGDAQRVRAAMKAVSERLTHPEDGLILLFTPPFDKTPRNPGYIKGYLPGIRENGGQYTHAALWTVWAHAELGQGDYAEELFRLLNPVYHADTPEKVECYRVEPYVVAADVYSVPPLTGHGGWTWYTGSAGWMYRLGVEAILGLRLDGKVLRVDPCIPSRWNEYEIIYRQGKTSYRIRVENPQGMQRGVREVCLDGELLQDGRIPLLGDGRDHEVRVIMGEAGAPVESRVRE